MSVDVAAHPEEFRPDVLKRTMNKLCRQVSIESPGPTMKDCVFSFIVPVPDTPPKGARIKIVCAGACYRRHRSPSISSISSVSSELSDYNVPIAAQTTPSAQQTSPAHQGIRDGAIFPGFEVAGVIETLGSELGPDCGFTVGQRVVIYPFDEAPNGYAELICVPDLKYLIPIPDSLPISVAAMLPTGALLAMSAVLQAHEIASELLKERGNDTICKMLIVGTGGLALWAVRIAQYHFHNSDYSRGRFDITVASLKDEGFMLAKEIENVKVVQWNEDLYEKQLIERTKDACNGLVDIVIDFGTTSRSLHRSMQCLTKGGVVLINDEVAEKLLPKFARLAEEREQKIEAVANGSIEQLHEVVKLVASGEIKPPPHSIFPCEQASEVVRKLCASEIPGRAILRFHDID
ncbi:zinc-type alcohol dehydrogenase-like protein C1773.06c isoform X1 [Hermetia illucens]|nr:zinc-type alcohol dehydrogenase-like protein C1773.06c isoform X1 [Hermetia illucens]